MSVQLGTNFATMGPLNFRAAMDELHMQELVCFPFVVVVVNINDL